MPLQTIHRPKTLDDIYGNEAIVESLKSVLSRKSDVPHAFLFTGPSGCGKTTFARILKNELKCSDSDFHEYNSSNTRGIDTIRDIDFKSKFLPKVGNIKIYMLDEVHGQTGNAQEAMLKMLEDTPKHVYYVLCTTEVEKLKATLKRRCHHYEVQSLLNATMNKLLNDTLEKEKTSISKEVLKKICSLAQGSAGKALNLLDKVIDVDDEEKAISVLEIANVSENSIIDLCRLLLDDKMNPKTRATKIRETVQTLNGDAEQARYAIMAYFSQVLLSDRANDRIAEMASCFIDSYITSGKLGLILSCHLASKL